MKKMKASLKLVLPVFILLLAAAAVYADDTNQPPPQPEPQTSPPPEPQGRSRVMFNDEYINQLLEKVRQEDPNEAQRLENLRLENPRLFHVEMRKLAFKSRGQEQGFDPNRPHRMPAFQGPPGETMGLRGKEPGRQRIHEKEMELLSWLSKNDPNEAKELTALSEKDPPAYARRLAVDSKKYREVIEAEQTNPALAELLKKDLDLKQKRNELLEKYKATTDEKQKAELMQQLKEVTSDQFDLIVQKKQLMYEELKKKLEDLQKDVNKSQADLENFKKNKEQHINNRLKELTDPNAQFNWD
jgi:hypothetical protein